MGASKSKHCPPYHCDHSCSCPGACGSGSSGPHHPHPHPHPYPPHRPFVPQGSSQDDGEVLIFNSPANDPAFGAIMAVPSGNYGSSVTFWNTAQPAIRPPGVIRIPRGAMVSVPASSTVTYDLWVERTGDRGVAAPPQPLVDTYSLRFGMNDANRQTVYTNAATGATLYRAYLSSGKDVFVFGQVSAALASSDPVGQVGTFVYTDSKHSLRWTNAYNLPDEWIKAPVPPGFVLETPGGGSSWLPAPKPIRIYNSPLNDPSFHTLVAVPNANYGASVQDWETASPAVRGPGVVAITRGQLVELPTGSHIYDLWLMQGGSGSGSGSAVPMMSTYGLHSSMNDSNKQTASADMTTGAVFFRTFDAQGGEVYVFGRIDTMSGSGSGIGPLGTYAYTDPALNLSLTWTNVHNRPNDGLVSPLPPGFALQSTA